MNNQTGDRQSIESFLDYLEKLNIKISISNDQNLKINAPEGALTETLRAELKQRKTELLAILKTDAKKQPVYYKPINVVSRSAEIYASFPQQRLWFLHQLAEGKSRLYNLPLFLRASGTLQLAVLQASVNEIINRHEVLRTVFAPPEEGEKEPYQQVLPQLTLDVPCADLTCFDQPEREQEITRLITQEARHEFDLCAGPLLRLSVIKAATTEYLLLFHFHHTIFDGLSIGILLHELNVLYTAFLHQRSSPLAPLDIQYADFSQWQRDLLTGDYAAQQLDFWRSHLAGAPAFINLPVDHPRPVNQVLRGARQQFELNSGLTRRLRALSQANQVTLFMTLYAAFAVFLARHANSEDLVIGMPVANRSHRQLESMIGFFANTLALRFQPDRDMRFTDFLQQVRQTVVESLQHQSMPFEKLVDELNIERSLNHNPIFQVMFTFQEAYLDNFKLADLTLTPLDFEQHEAKFDLSLMVREYQDKLVCIFEYTADLFETDTIQRMQARFQHLVEQITQIPQARTADLPLLTNDEKSRVLTEFNTTDRTFPATMVHHLFEQQAMRQPEQLAVVFNDEHMTYAELNRKANQLAHYLIAQGVQTETLVGICLQRSLNLLVSVLGILKAGGSYIPLDPNYPDDRLRFILQDSAASILITQADLAERWASDHRRHLCLDTDWQTIATYPDNNLTVQSQPGHLAYVIYTSGSTGKPKGVMVAHHNLSNAYYAYHEAYDLANIRHHLQMANPAFDVFTGDWVRALCSGGKLVLCPTEFLALPEQLYALMAEERIEFAEFVPAIIRQLNHYLKHSGKRLDFMQGCVISSDTCYMREYREFQSLCGSDTKVISAYGVTEATIDSCYMADVDMRLPDDAIVPIGKPLANTYIYILDAQQNPVPIGVTGEMYIGGAGVAQGYLKRAELSAEKFVTVSLNGKNHHLYKSGDAARWRADGNLDFIGRLDNQVKLRGLRIELGEIETCLLQYDSVKEAVVILHQNQGEPCLVAYVTLSGSIDDPAHILRSWLEPLLPNYMVPAFFVVLDTLPLTPNGKVNRQALPVPDTSSVKSGYVAPRDSLELRLTLLWEDVLGISPVSVKDNFFNIGGDSLLSIRLISNIHREFGIRIPLHNMFQHGTVEGISSLLRGGGAVSTWSPLVCLQPEGSKSPLFCVHAAGGIVFRYLQVASLLGTDRPFYGLQARGIEPGDALYDSIEDMAADYVQAIRTIQPQGPYLLSGWSFGGTVAFEMARILEQAGESVPHLLMVDAPSPYVDNYEQNEVEFLLERLRPAAGLVLDDVYDKNSREAQLLYLFQEQKLAGLFSPDIDFAEAELRLKIHMHHNKIICEYRPAGPFNGKITFFKPTEAIPFDTRMCNPIPAWEAFADKGIEVHDAPGNHFNMFSSDHGPVLAQKMKACIRMIEPDLIE